MSAARSDKFDFRTATAVIVANMIGTGVFTSLGFQLAEFRSGFLLLLLWAAGGLASLCGAMSYAELGAALPRSGGEYNFLTRIYHPAAGFISGWISSTIGFAAPVALAAMTFGAYLSASLGDSAPAWAAKALAVSLVLALTLIHATNRRNSGGTQLVFTILKVGVIVAFCAAGIMLGGEGQNVRFLPTLTDTQPLFSGSFAIALIYVSYAYAGWNAATYLSSELDEPQKSLPRILFAGTAIVTVLYVALNFVFLVAAPMDAMVGKIEIGFIAAEHLFGGGAAKLTGLALALLLISTVSSMTMAGPRVLHAIGEDFPTFDFLGRRNKAGVPARAIYFQSAVALVFIITSSFQSVLIFAGFTVALNSFVTVIGVFVLRIREPLLSRPYKVSFYPLTPLIYLSLTGWTLLYVLIDRPTEALFAIGLIAAGLVAFLLSRHQLKH